MYYINIYISIYIYIYISAQQIYLEGACNNLMTSVIK